MIKASKTVPCDPPAGTIWHFDESALIAELGALRLYPAGTAFKGAGRSQRRGSKWVSPLAGEGLDRVTDIRAASIRCVRAYNRSMALEAERNAAVRQIKSLL